MSEESRKLHMVYQKLVGIKMEVERAMNLVMELRTSEPEPSGLPPPGGLTFEEAVEYVKRRLPEGVVPDLTFSLSAGRQVRIQAERWLEDGWGQVNDVVLGLGGSWRSAGKESCWLVPFPEGRIR